MKNTKKVAEKKTTSKKSKTVAKKTTTKKASVKKETAVKEKKTCKCNGDKSKCTCGGKCNHKAGEKHECACKRKQSAMEALLNEVFSNLNANELIKDYFYTELINKGFEESQAEELASLLDVDVQIEGEVSIKG